MTWHDFTPNMRFSRESFSVTVAVHMYKGHSKEIAIYISDHVAMKARFKRGEYVKCVWGKKEHQGFARILKYEYGYKLTCNPRGRNALRFKLSKFPPGASRNDHPATDVAECVVIGPQVIQIKLPDWFWTVDYGRHDVVTKKDAAQAKVVRIR